MLYEGPDKLSAHDIPWRYHEDVIATDKNPYLVLYKKKNGGVSWRGHSNIFLTPITVFHQNGRKLTNSAPILTIQLL